MLDVYAKAYIIKPCTRNRVHRPGGTGDPDWSNIMTTITLGKIQKSTGMLGTARRTFEVPAIFIDGEFFVAFKEGQDAEAAAALADLQAKADAHKSSGTDTAFYVY